MLLPSDLEPRSFLGADAISFSEFGTLARCEAAWVYGYTGEREPNNPSAAMKLGSELHRLWGNWWTGGDWTATEDEKASWLMSRYAERYVPESMNITMLENEKPMAALLPAGPWFFGFADGLVVDDNGEMWVAELKTTDSLSKVTHLTRSNQMPLYIWAARAMGYPVVGAMLDVIRTFKPVKKDLALEESFDRRWLRFEDGEIERAVAEMGSAVRIRRELSAGERAPIRAVGPSCSWCFCVSPCFGLDVEIADDEDL